MQNLIRNIGLVVLVVVLSYSESEGRAQALASTQPQGKLVGVAEITVTGKVISETGEGLPGVSVLLKGTSIGTSTNVEGQYSLTVPDANAILVFSYIGYTVEEVAVNNRTIIDVSMVPDIKSLSEVVVVGYGSQKKSDVTGALSSISAEQIQAVPVQNITQALQGRAAGVDIAAGNFRPGEAPSIRIRGNRSVRASNEPLYVVDGIPLAQGTGINDFNPQDIQSVEVLKDASATAIYGSRGANGVILITTKKGKANKFTINYDTYVAFDEPLVEQKMFNGGEFAQLRRDAFYFGNAVSYRYPYPDPNEDYSGNGANFSIDPNMWEAVSQGYEWIDKNARIPKTRPVTAEEKTKFQQYYDYNVERLKRFYVDPAAAQKEINKLINPSTITEIPIYDASRVTTTDWLKYAMRTGISQSHQLNISGGTDKIRVSLSGGYLKQQGIQLTQDFSRYNVRLNIDYKVNDFITVGASNNANLNIQNYGASMYGNTVGKLPITVPYDANGEFVLLPGGVTTILNPVRDPGLVFNERRSTRYFGSFYGEVNILKGLRYRMNFGPDLRQSRRGEFQAGRSSYRNSTNWASNNQDQRFSYVLENLLFFDKSFGKAHTLGVTLLQSVQDERFESLSVAASNLPYESQKWYDISSTYTGTPDSYGSGFSQTKLQSWMGRINYTLLDKYLLTVSGRFDGSSVLAPGNKWDFFPSFALAWKAHQEDFLKNVVFLDELKFRVGYGSVGQSSVGAYLTSGTLQRSLYTFDEIPAYGYTPTPGTAAGTVGGLPLPDLSWERTSTINAGLDFGLLNNRITGTVDVYNANTTDLLLPRAIPTASGYNNVLQNIGATRNKGVEVSLSTINVTNGNGFEWGTDVIFTKNKEEFVTLASGPQSDVGNRWFIGSPLGVFYDYKFDGIWQSTPEDLAAIQVYRDKGNTSYAPGVIRVVDVNDDKIINELDRTILGSTVPKWTGSITNRFSFKGFDLSCMVYARIGQMAYNGGSRPGLTGNFQDRQINYWTPANPSNEYPIPNRNLGSPLYSESLLYQKASFVKIRSISLTYNFPKALIAKAKLSNLSVYVNAVNPFLFTKFNGLDPEATDSGASSTQIGESRGLSTKSLVIGMRVGL